MTDVITGLSPRWESPVATSLETARGLTVVRRCADVAELAAVAEAGVGECAVVSSDLRGLDLTVLDRLRRHGVRVIGLHPPGDDQGERRLRQLGLVAVLSTEATPEAFAAAVEGVGASALDLPSVAGPGPLVGEPDGGGAGGDVGWRPAGSPALPGRTSPGQPGGDDFSVAVPGASGSPGPREGGPPDGIIVAVWGPTGAPGRTTVAVNLAAELASRGVPALLVDADTYGGSISQALGLLDEAPGIAAACRAADHGTLDLPALSRLAPQVTPGLRVLTGLPKADRWPELRAASYERVLTLCRSLAAVIVVDCGFCLEDDEELSYDTAAPRRNEATLTSLAESDVVVAVGGADPVALQRFVRALQDLGSVPSAAPLPVVNRVRATAVGSRPEVRIADSLRRFAGFETVHFLPDDGPAVDAALLAGRSVVEHAPDSALRVAVAELASLVAPSSRTRTAARRTGWRRRGRGA